MCTVTLQTSVFNSSWATSTAKGGSWPQCCSKWPQFPPQAKTVCRATPTLLNTFHHSRFRFAMGGLAGRQLEAVGKASGPCARQTHLPWIPQQGKRGGLVRGCTCVLCSRGSLGEVCASALSLQQTPACTAVPARRQLSCYYIFRTHTF